MKIGVWHNTGGGGGARRHLYQHVKGLLERGHEVISCCPEFTSRGDFDIGSLVHQKHIPVPGRFEGRRFLHGRRNYNRALHRAMDAHAKKASAFLNEQRIDVLLAANCALTCIPAVGRFVRAPKVMYIQESNRGYEGLYNGWAYPEALEKFSPWSYWGIIERWHDQVQLQNRRIYLRRNIDCAKAYDLLLANSYISRELLWRSYGLPVKVSYIGVDTTLFQHQGKVREPFVLGVGSYAVHKNIPFLIRAVAGCATRIPLVWVGNSGAEAKAQEFKAYAAQLGVDFRPHFGLDDQQLVDLYNRASLHVCAPRLEPFGLTPLEAGSCGCPVLGLREGGLRETIIDGVTGLLLDESEEAFARTIDRLLAEPAVLERYGKEGIKWVSTRWSLNESISRLEAHLLSVLRGSHG